MRGVKSKNLRLLIILKFKFGHKFEPLWGTHIIAETQTAPQSKTILTPHFYSLQVSVRLSRLCV